MPSGFTVSDLHLFSKRSRAERFLPEIYRKADQSELLVLNGDIFDFQWSKQNLPEDALVEAVDWIVSLVTSKSSCQFVFTIGNHDATPAYLQRLHELSTKYANLHWREHFFKVGQKIFLHGDALHGGITLQGLQDYRHSCSLKSYSEFTKTLYAGLTNIGGTSLANKLIGKRTACRRILLFLEETLPEETKAIQDVYFGHTHNYLHNYVYQDLRFHNCGGPFTGSKFSILPFSFSSEELEEAIEQSRHVPRSEATTHEESEHEKTRPS